MAAFLLTWNSDPDNWQSRLEDIERVQRRARRVFHWRCGHSKRIQKGDRVFMLKQGREPRGIIGSGRAIKAWRPIERRQTTGQGRTHNEVECIMDVLLDHDRRPPLGTELLRRIGFSPTLLNTQFSGVQIPEPLMQMLESAWLRHVGGGIPAADIDPELAMVEGEARERLVIHRHRERLLRDRKIEQVLRNNDGRLICEVPGCGFDFEERYGALGRGYAQVHHKSALSARTQPSRTRLSELAIVCANCHAMIHRNGECRPLTELIPPTLRTRR